MMRYLRYLTLAILTAGLSCLAWGIASVAVMVAESVKMVTG